MSRARVWKYVVAGLLMPATGCGGSDSSASHEVLIERFAFEPDTLRAGAGDTIVWVNRDPVPHTVTFSDGRDSGRMPAGGSWSMTAAGAGEWTYVCELHPTMTGVLIVR